jgi:hypothetical protein
VLCDTALQVSSIELDACYAAAVLQAFAALCKSLDLPSRLTYLDVSHHCALQDSDIALLLSRTSRTLRHLVARGTRLGPQCLIMLGSQVKTHV